MHLCYFTHVLLHSKILLHEHRATPKMTDLGFAVAPGTHTLVAIETTRVNLHVYINIEVIVSHFDGFPTSFVWVIVENYMESQV